MRNLGIWTATVLGALVAIARGAEETKTAEAPDYNSQIVPVFRQYCVGCHNATDREGDLVLESYPSLLEGGKHGAVIAAGNTDNSRLLLMLTGKAEPAMPPPDNERPTAEEIELVRAWIAAGAKSPTGEPPDPTRLVVPKIVPIGPRPDPIASIAWSPQGDVLAVARYGGVDLVSSVDGSLQRRVGPLRGRVNAVNFSTDGQRLIAAAGEPGLVGEAAVWNVADGALLRSIIAHLDSLYAVAISPDGTQAATGGYDQQIKLWDLATGNELRTFSGHNDCIYDLAFRRGGQVLASASGDRTAKLWDVASGERLETFGQPLKELYALAFSPDGGRLAAGGVDNRIRIWTVSPDAKENTNPLAISRFAHEGSIVRLSYSPDGAQLISTAEDRSAKIWNADTMSEVLALPRQSEVATGAAFSPDGTRIAIGRLDGTWSIYDAKTGQAPLPGVNANAVRNRTSAARGLQSAAALVLAAALADPAPPAPKLTALLPRGSERGKSMRAELRGENLAEATEIKTAHPEVKATLVGPARADGVDIDLVASENVPRGRYEVWLAGPKGETNRVPVFVDDLPQFAESEPNNGLSQASSLLLPGDCWGVLEQKGDVDCYSFEAAAGQTLVFDVAAASIGSKADITLTLSDTSGKTLAAVNDFDGQADPHLAFRFPAAGRYVLRVADLKLSGGADHFYRLTSGELPFATAIFPMSIAAHGESAVRLIGANLPPGVQVNVTAADPGEVAVPIPPAIRTRQPLKVIVGRFPESIEQEPNDAPEQATEIAAGSTVGGVIERPGDADWFRFQTPPGQGWIIETEAARRGSPVDTVVEVFWPDGRPVERLLLAATRDAALTFRGVDSNNNGDIRLTNWEEMELNDFVYMGGEVCKIFRQPRGPDSGFNFYEGEGGRRRTEFDTTATVHALDDPAYIVEVHPTTDKVPATGLPTFRLNYLNDDDGERSFGSDSRLRFLAPAAGPFLVRVCDSRGAGGPRFVYRLTVRPMMPDFAVRLGVENPSVAAGSGRSFTVIADRNDGFDGEIRVDFGGTLPPGFSLTTPVIIEAGHREARAVLTAAPDASAPTEANWSQTEITASATILGEPVRHSVKGLGKISLVPKPKVLVRLEPLEPLASGVPGEIHIKPGQRATAWLRIERNGFDGIVNLEVFNLPHGIIVDDIGLNNVQILEGQTERQIFFRAAGWVQPMVRPIHPLAKEEGEHAGSAATLVVD